MIEQIIAAMRSIRFPLKNEKELQAALSSRFTAVGIEHEREVRLSGKDVVDFMFGNVAAEVKTNGGKLQIYRQLERYCEHERVSKIILITNVPMGLPAAICGKPAYLFNLSRAWL